MKKIPFLLLVLLASCTKELSSPPLPAGGDVADVPVNNPNLPMTLAQRNISCAGVDITWSTNEGMVIPARTISLHFDSSFSPAVDSLDTIYKPSYTAQDIAWKNGSYLLAAESRPLPSTYKVISIKSWNYTTLNYRFTFTPHNMPEGYGFMLIDNNVEDSTGPKPIVYKRVWTQKPTTYDFYVWQGGYSDNEHRFQFKIWKL